MPDKCIDCGSNEICMFSMCVDCFEKGGGPRYTITNSMKVPIPLDDVLLWPLYDEEDK